MHNFLLTDYTKCEDCEQTYKADPWKPDKWWDSTSCIVQLQYCAHCHFWKSSPWWGKLAKVPFGHRTRFPTEGAQSLFCVANTPLAYTATFSAGSSHDSMGSFMAILHQHAAWNSGTVLSTFYWGSFWTTEHPPVKKMHGCKDTSV